MNNAQPVKIKNLSGIKKLLAAKKQAFNQLVENPDCLCIEGIFALAWGGHIIKKKQYIAVGIMGKIYKEWLTEKCYENSGLPVTVPAKLVKMLDLLPSQIQEIEKRQEISWLGLNDTVKLTFTQFAELLNIIEAESK
jgi:hypothetical protein